MSLRQKNKKNKLLFIFGTVFLNFVLANHVFAVDLTHGWSGDVFIGYNKVSGNTDKGSGSLSAQAIKELDKSKITLKANAFYSESDSKKDGQKYDALANYSLDFGREERWFNFYQVFIDHDYFADISYRITPALGLGYHLYRLEDLIWDIDAGVGYRITRHRMNKAADEEVPVALFHTFVKKKVFDNAFFSEDLTVYPGLKTSAGIIIRSETAFTNPLNEKLALELKYIFDYNSEPAAGKKSADAQFIAGIKYKF